jgi:hypothetical protein
MWTHQPEDLRDAAKLAIRVDDPPGLALGSILSDQRVP